MSDLANKSCVPCQKDTPTLEDEHSRELSSQIPEWEIVERHHLRREFRFGNFREALAFVNRIGEVAEEQGHHPDISFGWGWAEVSVFTHAVGGLTENDFILAAKLDGLYPAL